MRACVVVVVVVVFVSCVVGQRVEEREGKNERNENKGGSENCFVCFCLDKEKDLNKAFARYQKIRQAKANEVVKTSWQVGQIAHISSPIIAKIRNVSLSLMPSFLAKKQMKKLFTLPYLETRKEIG